jgi:hypothetical protein
MDTAQKLAVIVCIVAALRKRIPAIDNEYALLVAGLVGIGIEFLTGAASIRQTIVAGLLEGLTAAGGLHVAGYTAKKFGASVSKIGPALLLVGGTGLLGAGSSGCAALTAAHEYATSAQGYVDDAQAKLGELSAEISAALAVLPDVPPEAKAKIELTLASSQKALAAAILATKGVADLTDEKNLLSVFGDFIKAFDTLSEAASPFLARAHSGRLGAAPSDVVEPAVVRLAHRKAAR